MDDSCTLAQEYLVNMVGVRDMCESELAQTRYVCIYIYLKIAIIVSGLRQWYQQGTWFGKAL